MYSFAPLPLPTDSHLGFYLMVGGVSVVYFWLTSLYYADVQERIRTKKTPHVEVLHVALFVLQTAIAALIVLVSHHASYHPYVPENLKATAVFDRFVVRESEVQKGKNRTELVDTVYAQLRLEKTGEYVLIKGPSNAVYPPRIQLYWNSQSL